MQQQQLSQDQLQNANLFQDDQGQPFIVIQDQGSKKRMKGVDAIKDNINAAVSVSATLRTSLGPRGMDKILQSGDGEIVVTNDGATIMDKMELDHQAAKLLCQLSKSQDDEIGDGTTGVVVIAGALLEKCLYLLDKGLHPLNIARGFEKACESCMKTIESSAQEVNISKRDDLIDAAVTTLGSKVVNEYKEQLARICVDAVLSVADLENHDVNFDYIKIEGKVGGNVGDTELYSGIILDKEFSHPQMQTTIKDCKLAILTCPFEPPKPKTKNRLEITSAEDQSKLQQLEQDQFDDMIKRCKDSGADLIICQWGFDDEANHLLYSNRLPAVRWVSGDLIELLAIATGARIVPRFEELSADKLGQAKNVTQIHLGTTADKMIQISECKNTKAVTIVARGANKIIVEEVCRCIHDALCTVRNLIKDNKIVYGGGSIELACGIALEELADQEQTLEHQAIRAFAESLESIAVSLAKNSGLNPIETVANLKKAQKETGNRQLGVDSLDMGISDMQKQKVFESMNSKKQQIQLATQVTKMILKIDDVIKPDEAIDM